MARFTPWNKTKDCYVSEASTVRKKEANKGRSRLPRRLRDTFEEYRSFIGRNVLVSFVRFLLLHYFCADFVFLFGTRYGRPECCRKKSRSPPQTSCSSFSSPSSFPFSPPVERRTNDQRNVNRKPREATLINPTEINCSAQRRSSISLSLARRTPSFVRAPRFYSSRWSFTKYLEAVLKFPICYKIPRTMVNQTG